jgi:hypothetical protein
VPATFKDEIMRKWLCFGIVTIAAGTIGGVWLCSKPAPIRPVVTRPHVVPSGEKHDGEAETSDTIEPLVVDRGVGDVTVRLIPPAQEEMMPRVLFAPHMQQPPRPDAGSAPRMPYADEPEILAMPLDPVARILEAPNANLFDGLQLFFEEVLPPTAQPPAGYHRAIPFCER